MASSPSSSAAECDSFPAWGLTIGVLMGVLGSIGINVGQNLQATGVRSLHVKDQPFPWRSKVWRSGLGIFACFAIINFSALSLAPASILCPIEAIQFVSNVFYNRFVNKLQISLRVNVGVLLEVVGCILTVAFGAKSRCHSRREMEGYWTKPVWWIYVAATLTVALAAFFTHRFYRRRLLDHGISPPHHALLPISYTLYCALLGGSQLIVHAKVFSVLLSFLLRGDASVLGAWLFYAELLLVCMCGGLWGVKLTECLAMYEPLLIIPLMVGTYIVLGGVAGGIFFGEFSTLHEATAAGVWGWALYISGMLLMVGGLILIADPEAPASAAPPTSVAAAVASPTLRVTDVDKEETAANGPTVPPLLLSCQSAPAEVVLAAQQQEHRVVGPERSAPPFLCSPSATPAEPFASASVAPQPHRPTPLMRAQSQNILRLTSLAPNLNSEQVSRRLFTPAPGLPPNPFGMVIAARQGKLGLGADVEGGRSSPTGGGGAAERRKKPMGGSAPIRMQTVPRADSGFIGGSRVRFQTKPAPTALVGVRDTFPLPRRLGSNSRLGVFTRTRSQARVFPEGGALTTALAAVAEDTDDHVRRCQDGEALDALAGPTKETSNPRATIVLTPKSEASLGVPEGVEIERP